MTSSAFNNLILPSDTFALIFNNSTLNLCLQERQFIVTRGGNLTYNGDSRVGKLTFENLKMSNFPWAARYPVLGQTIPGANHCNN